MQGKFARSGISIDESTAKHLIAVAANIPHYIQLLAAETWQYMITSQTTVTRDIVNECAKLILVLKNDYYMELYDRQSTSRKQLLKALTFSGQAIFSAAYTKTHRLPATATLQRAVRELINNGIIEKTNNEYFIADPFFKLFVSGV